MRRGHHSGLSGAGAGIFPQWGILKNNRKESIHETRWTSPRRRPPGWITERRHSGHAGGAVGIAGRAGGYCYRGTGRHRTERHQRVGAGICGLCDTGQDTRAAKGGTRRSAIARDTLRYVRFGHRQLVRRLVPVCVSQRAVLGHIRWKDFVRKRAVFADIFYGLKTLCRLGARVTPRPKVAGFCLS